MAKRRTEVDDVDADLFDENGVLRDKAHWRVPMFLMDSTQREIATAGADHWARVRDSRPHITDAAGNTGAALQRPGYRLVVGDAGDARELAMQDYHRDLENAWRAPTHDADTGVGSPHVLSGAHPGDQCTVRGAEYPADFGSPGTLKSVDGKLVCVPNAPRGSKASSDGFIDERAAAYAAYDQAAASAWRNPR